MISPGRSFNFARFSEQIPNSFNRHQIKFGQSGINLGCRFFKLHLKYLGDRHVSQRNEVTFRDKKRPPWSVANQAAEEAKLW